MKQFQIAYKNDHAFQQELDKIKKWCGENPAYTTVFRIYAAVMDINPVRHICEVLDAEMPDALYLGCTTNANIMNGALADSEIILTCTVFERPTTRAELRQISFSKETIRDDVRKLKKYCDDNQWISAMEIHMTRHNVTKLGMSVREFCDELDTLREDILIYGGGAYMPDSTTNISTAVYTKGGEFSDHGIAFLLLGGEDLRTYGMHISGWKPLKRQFKITRADQTILYELDGEPAFNIYQNFLNIEKNEQLISNTQEFPLFLDYGGTDVMRVPLEIYDDNSLLLSSVIPDGTTARLAYGDFETILDSIRHDGQNIADFQPEIILAFSCTARRGFWGDDNISSETILFNSVAPTAGFYTGGEFLRINGFMFEFDVTLVLVGMREGDPKNKEIVRMANAQLGGADSEKVPLIRRFAAFIERSTIEFEALNSQLSKLNDQLAELNSQLAITSVTDGLTKLYNRAEIERKIRAAVNGRVSSKLSLVMLDIDDFKKVNDVYGHQEGDQVIIALADILRKVTDGTSASLGRWGGEEFMILLPSSAVDEATALAEKIRTEYAKVSYEAADHQTVSVGVVQAKDGEDTDALYSRVDKALYVAKAGGKNQVVTLDESFTQRRITE